MKKVLSIICLSAFLSASVSAECLSTYRAAIEKKQSGETKRAIIGGTATIIVGGAVAIMMPYVGIPVLVVGAVTSLWQGHKKEEILGAYLYAMGEKIWWPEHKKINSKKDNTWEEKSLEKCFEKTVKRVDGVISKYGIAMTRNDLRIAVKSVIENFDKNSTFCPDNVVLTPRSFIDMVAMGVIIKVNNSTALTEALEDYDAWVK